MSKIINCKKCGLTPENNESNLDLHHILPKAFGGNDRDGRIYLCGENKGNDCHRKLHKKLSQIIKEWTIKWLE